MQYAAEQSAAPLGHATGELRAPAVASTVVASNAGASPGVPAVASMAVASVLAVASPGVPAVASMVVASILAVALMAVA